MILEKMVREVFSEAVAYKQRLKLSEDAIMKMSYRLLYQAKRTVSLSCCYVTKPPQNSLTQNNWHLFSS